jgi:hypothetical protein
MVSKPPGVNVVLLGVMPVAEAVIVALAIAAPV